MPRIVLNSNSPSLQGSRGPSRGASRENVPDRNKSTNAATAAARKALVESEALYREIELEIDEKMLTSGCDESLVKHEVSFDTVVVNYSTDGREDSFSDSDSDCDGDIRSHSPFRDRSPYRDGSPSPGLQSAFSRCSSESPGNGARRFDSRGFRVDYPTNSAIKYDSFTLNSESKSFTTVQRTILVYISGRRHTWVGLDYVVDMVLRGGDHLVVVSSVPIKHGKDKPQFQFKARRVQKYVALLVPPSVTYKLTVDLFLGRSTMEILGEASAIYTPHAIIVSHKPNQRFVQAHTWNSSRMSARLMKNLRVPLIIVSAMKMNRFEVEFFDKLVQQRHWTSANLSELKDLLRLQDEKEESLASIGQKVQHTLEEETQSDDTDSVDSLSMESVDSDELETRNFARFVKSRRAELARTISEAEKQTMGTTSFMENLNTVSDASYRISSQFVSISKSAGGEDLIRSLSGMAKLEKHKSMLDVLDTTESEKLLQLRNQLSHTPYSSHNQTPQPRVIKFDMNLPNSRRQSIESDAIRKVMSNVDTSSSRRLSHTALEPSKSHQGLTKSRSESKVPQLKEKKRSGFLRKMFGR